MAVCSVRCELLRGTLNWYGLPKKGLDLHIRFLGNVCLRPKAKRFICENMSDSFDVKSDFFLLLGSFGDCGGGFLTGKIKISWIKIETLCLFNALRWKFSVGDVLN